MTKRKLSKPTEESKPFFMLPSLHQRVLRAVADDSLYPRFIKRNSDDESTRKYETHVMGVFICTYNDCSGSSWASKEVAIVIRRYPNNGYNAVIFNQRCQVCHKLGSLSLNENSYVERVAYRLKKWAGVQMERPHYVKKKGLTLSQASTGWVTVIRPSADD